MYICGLPPSRIDILTRIKGVDFETAWKKRERSTFAGVETQFLSLELLIDAKRSAGREQDKLDLKKLRALTTKQSSKNSKTTPTRKVVHKRTRKTKGTNK